MKNKVCSWSFVVCSLFFIACGENKENKKDASPFDSAQGDKLSMTTNINSVKINLPDSAGKDIFEANCLTCHSSAYIQMQPNFSRKTWEKTVDKMKKNYGAPMDSVSAVKIVDYLMAIKGKK